MNFPDGLPAYTPTDTKISNILTFENLSDVEQSQKIINRLFFIKSESIYYRYDVENDDMVPAFSGSSGNMSEGTNITINDHTISTVLNPTFEEIIITNTTFENNNVVSKTYVDNAINAIVPPDFPKRNSIYELGKIYTFPIFIKNTGTSDSMFFNNINGYFTFSIDGFCHVSFNDNLFVEAPFISPTSDPVAFNIPFELNAGTKPTDRETFGTESSYYVQIINNGFLSGNDNKGINTFVIDNTVSTNSMYAYSTPTALPPNMANSVITVAQIYDKVSPIRYSYSYMPKYPLVPINF